MPTPPPPIITWPPPGTTPVVDLSFTLEWVPGDSVPAATASPAQTLITAAPASIAAGSGTSTITVQLRDATGANVGTGTGYAVALATTGGTLSPVVNHGNGTYTATLTAPAGAGTATVSGTLNGTAIADTAAVTVTAAAGAPSQYVVTSSSAAPAAGGQVTITAQLADAQGVAVAQAGRTVTWSKTGVGGAFAAATSQTDGQGVATVVLTVGAAGTVHTVTANDGTYTGTSGPVTVAAVFVENFAGAAVGSALPAGFSAEWDTVAADISVVAEAGTPGGKILRITPGASRRTAIRWAAPGAAVGDVEVFAIFRTAQPDTSATVAGGILARAGGDGTSESGYLLHLGQDEGSNRIIRIARYEAGAVATLEYVPEEWATGQWTCLLAKATGARIQGRTWPLGGADPQVWQVDEVDPAPHAAGWLGVLGFEAVAHDIAYISAALGGGAAPRPS